ERKAAGVEGYGAGHVHLERAVRLLGDIDTHVGCAGVLHIATNPIPVVARDATCQRTDTCAYRGSTAAVTENGAQASANGGARSGPDSCTAALFSSAPGQQHTGSGERSHTQCDIGFHVFSFVFKFG